MSEVFDFLSPTDKPALLAISTPEWLSMAQAALVELGYKVHAIAAHDEFPGRYSQVQYQVVIIEELFGGTIPTENITLQYIQRLPMNQRRHSVICLLSDAYETLNALQAFQQSVHAVINYSEMALLAQLIQKVVADNDLFLNTYRETQQRLAQGKS
jgi:hypothetical protein